MNRQGMVSCSKISVECLDRDISCNDGATLCTMDFFVRKDRVEEMFKFITLALGHFSIDPVGMYMSNEGFKANDELHTKSRIIAELHEYASKNIKGISRVM